MRWFLVLMCMVAVGPYVGGCSSRQQVDRDSSSVETDKETNSAREVAIPVKPETEVLVFRAKYYQTTGPCIQFGDDLAMPIIDAFEVVEFVKGDLNTKSIYVRAMTEGGSAYPKEMAEGKIYMLRLTPSERTEKQLREHQNENGTFLWIDGDEIEKQKAAK